MSSACPSLNSALANGSSDVGPSQSVSAEDLARLKFVAYGIVGCVVIAMGIFGNVVNLAVLTQPNLKGVTFVYLTWLATSDLMTMLVSITSMVRLHGVQPRSFAAAVYFAHIEVPLVNAFMASSVFLVVSLTVDRYFSVCLPTRFKEVHNLQRARCSIAAAYLVAFLLYVPVCFQKTPIAIINELTNETEYIACEATSVVHSPIFKIYLMIKEVIVRLGPVALLAVLNTTIIVTFRKTMRKRRDLLNSSTSSSREGGGGGGGGGGKKFREERRLLGLLGGIVILFVLCMTPAGILTILNSDDKESDFSFQVFRAVTNCLELANYSMNFYVYCLCSPEIRRTFIGLMKCQKNKRDATAIIGRPSSTENSTRL